MFLTLKKYDIISCIMAVALAFMTFGYIKSECDSVVTSALPVGGRIIVIDAGHGYPDGGAVSENGVTEKELNLDIAFRLQKLFEQSGAYVLLTRADDNAVADDLKEKIREIKRSDLKNRRLFKENSGCDAFISIHMNKFPESKYNGAQVFYAKEPSGSAFLGNSIQTRLVSMLNPDNKRAAKETDGSIFILKDSSVPSVIVECGFLSNPQEEKKLQSEEYRREIAYAVYSGTLDYFDSLN